MPERLEKLRVTLRDLESELASLDSIDQETRSVLESAMEEISEALRRQDSEALAHHPSLAERLQEAAEGFETSHPNLFGIVGRAVDALGQMGI